MLSKTFQRSFSSLLKKRVAEQIPEVQSQVRSILKQHGKTKVDEVRVEHVIQGMKELPLMFYPCSSLDPSEGIRFRGLSIPQLQQQLPKIKNQPIPEAVYWLLMTGEVPKQNELENLQRELCTEDELPQSTQDLIKSHASSHHPMTLLSMCILDLQKNSIFFKRYGEGTLKKSDFWEATYDDSINILKILPKIAGLIYTTKFNKQSAQLSNTDWAGRYANYMGYESEEMAEVLRGYLGIHTDHEGGNISAHSAYVASSALCDSYLSLCNAINGLAGPLHGLANQEVLKFLLKTKEAVENEGLDLNNCESQEMKQFLTRFVKDWLKKGVIPGYGHGRLRTTDPRYTHLKDLAKEMMSDKKLVKLTHAMENIITPVLTDLGKVKNPNPNVDAHSGVLLYELGLTEYDYYTVIFAVSRAMGCFSNTIWARAIGLPLERPGSMTLEQMKDFLKI